jgi:predicted aldo/keto reductase-like oxidoreductase
MSWPNENPDKNSIYPLRVGFEKLKVVDAKAPLSLDLTFSDIEKASQKKADACARCETCIPKCPAALSIPDRLCEAAELFEGRVSV